MEINSEERFRDKNLLDIELLRTKIAADLHDHIGSGLTEIAILSEMLSKQLSGNDPDIQEKLKKIRERSRDLIDSMSDIVWFVNPKRDSLYDLILRLKDTYEDLLFYSNISFKTQNLIRLEKIVLSMVYRQNLFLIFKEAIHNSIKHSGCTEICFDIQVNGKHIKLTLKDDGNGFDRDRVASGDGLENMMRRSSDIGGSLRIDTLPGKGTVIEFKGDID